MELPQKVAGRGVPAGLRGHFSEPLNRTTWGLVGSNLVTAGLGMLFWVIAARIFDTFTVGRDSALIASILAIAAICQLNLQVLIPRFLPQVRTHVAKRITHAYMLGAGLSLFAGLAFVLLAPVASDQFEFLRDDATLSLVFVIGTAAWAVFVLQDAALTALSRASWLPVENGAFSIMKILLLPVAVWLGMTNGPFASWLVPLIVIIPVVNWLLFRRVVPAAEVAQADAAGVVDVFGWSRLLKFIAQDVAGTVFGQLAMAAMPFLVIAMLGAEQNAYFYIPFMIVTAWDLVFMAACLSLTTEAARTVERTRHLSRMTVRRFTRLQLPGALTIALFASAILLLFGQDYAENGTEVLRLLALASAFRCWTFLYAAGARLQAHGTQLLCFQALLAIALIAGVVTFAPSGGIDAVAQVWLAAHLIAAAVVTIPVIKFLGEPRIPGSENDPYARSATVDDGT